MAQYLREFKTLADSLTAINAAMSPKEVVLQVLRGLPSEYQTFKTLVTHSKEDLSFADLKTQLLLEESWQTLNLLPQSILLMLASKHHNMILVILRMVAVVPKANTTEIMVGKIKAIGISRTATLVPPMAHVSFSRSA